MGWCRIKLDHRSREALERDTNSYGLRTENMLIETFGNLLVPKVASYLTAQVMLRLISKKVVISKLKFLIIHLYYYYLICLREKQQ